MNYPWYHLVDDDELKQGDILEDCPVFAPPSDLTLNILKGHNAEGTFEWEERDVIVMSQSCDMVKGREKIKDVLLCAVWYQSELAKLPEEPLSNIVGMEEARKGRRPAFQVLNECDVTNPKKEFRVVDFRRTYTLPLGFCREFAANAKERIRLLPPYREHLSQSFARFFMRVGLPTDIPPFK